MEEPRWVKVNGTWYLVWPDGQVTMYCVDEERKKCGAIDVYHVF